MPRGDIPFVGLDPFRPDGPLRDFWFSRIEFDHAYTYLCWKALNSETAINVVAHPDAIYRGIREDKARWGFCYVGRPGRWYNRKEVLEPFPPDLAYCVFINNRYVVFEWRAEKLAGEIDRMALRHEDVRFEEVLWTRTTGTKRQSR